METSYFCWKCKTKSHWANEVCPKETKEPSPSEPAEVPGPIRKAQEFIERVEKVKLGRPKKYPDRKTQMRELMRKRRARG